MFKKSLLAVAVLGTAAGFACAADVTLYGKVDAGLVYTNTQTKTTAVNGDVSKVKNHVFDMQNGVNAASRFGLKGTEDLGNGLKVGFKLENGFNVDDGTLGNDGRLFDREASLSVSGDFGTLSAGRMGGVGSGAGTYNLFTATADAFDGGNVDTFGLVTTSRYDNMLTYQTPKFAGVQGTFQYSFKGNNVEDEDAATYDASKGREGSAATDRYASVGLTGDFGALQTVLTYEYLNYASNNGAGLGNKDAKDGQLISLGGNYDCGFAKTFIAAQYFKDMKDSESIIDVKTAGYTKGYAVALGTIVPVASGDLTAAAYYNDYEVEYGETDAAKEDGDGKYYGLTVKYEYPLSKRTSIYTGAGVAQEKFDYKNNSEKKETMYQAFAGLTHSF
ncbi:MAG: porin [Sutterella wadsworthensis]|nr:porin [Sutterella wadsworthensis]